MGDDLTFVIAWGQQYDYFEKEEQYNGYGDKHSKIVIVMLGLRHGQTGQKLWPIYAVTDEEITLVGGLR